MKTALLIALVLISCKCSTASKDVGKEHSVSFDKFVFGDAMPYDTTFTSRNHVLGLRYLFLHGGGTLSANKTEDTFFINCADGYRDTFPKEEPCNHSQILYDSSVKFEWDSGNGRLGISYKK